MRGPCVDIASCKLAALIFTCIYSKVYVLYVSCKKQIFYLLKRLSQRNLNDIVVFTILAGKAGLHLKTFWRLQESIFRLEISFL